MFTIFTRTCKSRSRFKRYSSVNHGNKEVLGESQGLNLKAAQAGLGGAVFQMFNHGTISAMLFILVGVVYERAHHRDIDGFGVSVLEGFCLF